MIVYVTGSPGSGKTLWTISEVKRACDEWPKLRVGMIEAGTAPDSLPESRPVYYWFPPQTASVSEALNWERLKDANEAHNCPAWSIIVVDEAWQPWPQGQPGRQPAELEPFATHRHRGHDFYIITQRTTSVHHFIRGLVGRHVHFERQFGLERSRRFEWQKLGNPSDPWSKKEAMASEFRFPKANYALYKSADVHTVQKRLPWGRIAAMGAGAVVVVALFAYVFSRFGSHRAVAEVAEEVRSQGERTEAKIDALQDTVAKALAAVRWTQRFEERAPGFPYSAPFYDQTLKPVSFPKISGCSLIEVDGVVRCSCNTQQGTVITTLTMQQCVNYVRNGWFDPSAPDPKEPEESKGGKSGSGGGSPPSMGLEGQGGGGAGSGATAPAASGGGAELLR